VRVDSGVVDGTVVGTDYDPMLAKVIAHGADRAQALARLDAALAETALLGVTTNVAFLRRLLALDEVRAGDLDTGLVDRVAAGLAESDGADALEGGAGGEQEQTLLAAAWLATRPDPSTARDPFRAAGPWRVGGGGVTRLRLALGSGPGTEVVVDGDGALVDLAARLPAHVRGRHDADGTLHLEIDGVTGRWESLAVPDGWLLGREGRSYEVRIHPWLRSATAAAALEGGGPLRAPLPGTVVAVEVAEGDAVAAGDVLLVLEAMKMEHPVVAPVDGTVRGLAVAAGDRVAVDDALVEVVAAAAEEASA
jgi:acetyl-CoA/propionyl-CoA carboxylase biotin carboxyl carrier protein